MNVPDLVRGWLGKAENDLLNVENNLQAARVPWDTVCFHAQQAAEKTLKAYLVFQGVDPPPSHNLPRLLTLCQEHDPTFARLLPLAQRLTPYAVEVRYDAMASPTPDDGLEAAEAARAIRRFVLDRLPKDVQP